jgi:hypothetical protein
MVGVVVRNRASPTCLKQHKRKKAALNFSRLTRPLCFTLSNTKAIKLLGHRCVLNTRRPQRVQSHALNCLRSSINGKSPSAANTEALLALLVTSQRPKNRTTQLTRTTKD